MNTATTQREKMEIYAEFSLYLDVIENGVETFQSKRSASSKVPLFKQIENSLKVIADFYKSLDKELYPLAYPGAEDFESKEFQDFAKGYFSNQQEPNLV